MNFKKIMVFTMLCTLVLGVTGCGKKGTDPSLIADSKANVYRCEELNLLPETQTDVPEEDRTSGTDYSVRNLGVIDDKIVVVAGCYSWNNDPATGEYSWSDSVQLITAGADGSNLQMKQLWLQNRDTNTDAMATYMNNTALSEHYVYGVLRSEDYENLNEYGQPTITADLYCWNLDGEVVYQISIVPEKLEEDEWFWIEKLMPLAGDKVLVSAMGKFTTYDSTGTALYTIEAESESGFSNILMAKNDNLLLGSWNETWTKQVFRTCNPATGEMGEEVEIPFSSNHYQFRDSRMHDMLLTDNNGIYKYNLGDAEPTMFMSYVNSDISATAMNNIVELSDTQFVANYYDNAQQKQCIGLFTYVAPEDIPDKDVIEVAAFNIPYDMRNHIVEFNKTNENYRVVTRDYSRYSTDSDYLAGYTKLNNDILAGDMPDILVMVDSGNEIPIDSYEEKGLFEDLNKFIDKDPEIKREDLFGNVLEAYSTDGKLYRMPVNFYVQTLMGKTENVGPGPRWTMKEMMEAFAKMPEGASILGDQTTRDSVLWTFSTMAISDYIDETTGQCNFNSQGFKDVLTFLKDFPVEVNLDYEDPSYWQQFETQYRDNRTMLMQISLNNLDYMIYNFGQMGTSDVSFVGFPTEKGMGAVISSGQQYGISAKSPNQEGAWEFLRYYLTDEYQKQTYDMPMNKRIWLDKALECTERPHYEDEEGNIIYEDYTYWLGEQEIVIDPLTKEQVDSIYNYVSFINKRMSYDTSLLDIIKEEAAYFFEGDKTVDEVAEIIQGRIQLYMDEKG